MDSQDSEEPLSRISTLWSVVRRTSAGQPEEVAASLQELMLRYGKAVHRYLLGALRNADAAEELAQEFALRFIRGDFNRVDPGRGRFRDFIKAVLSHMVADFYRRPQSRAVSMPEGLEPATPPEESDLDRNLIENWKRELLGRTWELLEGIQRRTGQPFHTVLLCRANNPDTPSHQLADQLSAELGRPVSGDWVRQTLRRARDKFADLMIREVVQTLEVADVDQVEQELLELGLLEYCRTALQRYRSKP